MLCIVAHQKWDIGQTITCNITKQTTMRKNLNLLCFCMALLIFAHSFAAKVATILEDISNEMSKI